MSDTEADLAGLRAVAEAATPGPWEVEGDEHGREVLGPRQKRPGGWECAVLSDTASPANAAHIAAFDPPTVLALLDRLEAAERALVAERGSVEFLLEQKADLFAQIDDHCAAARVRAERWKTRCLAELAKVQRVEALADELAALAAQRSISTAGMLSVGEGSGLYMAEARLRAALADPGDERGQ